MRLSLFLVIVMAIISVLCIWIKLYTTEGIFEDGPSIFVIVKDKPSLDNKRIVTWNQVEKVPILICDENEYIGMSVYAAIVTWVWMVFPLLTIILLMGRKLWYTREK